MWSQAEVPSLTLHFPTCIVRGLGVKDNWGLFNYHGFTDRNGEFAEGTEYQLEYAGRRYTGKFDPANLFRDEQGIHDVSFYRFDINNLPTFPALWKRFLTEAQASERDRYDIMIEASEGTQSSKAIVVRDGTRYRVSFGYQNVKFAAHYRALTVFGDCGSPVYILDRQYTGKILGIHVAGTGNQNDPVGICNIVTQEMIQNATSLPEPNMEQKEFYAQQPINNDNMADQWMNPEEETDELEPMVHEPVEHCHEMDTSIDYLDYIRKMPNIKRAENAKPDEIFLQPGGTRLETSEFGEMYPDWKGVKRPAHLHVTDTVNPIRVGVKNVGMIEHPPADQALVDKVYEDMYRSLKDKLTWPVGRRQLTFEEAVFGIPGVFAGMNLATSPGYPLKRQTTEPGKRDFIKIMADETRWTAPILKPAVEAYLARMDSGELPENIWLGYLKDELVSPQKRAEGRTRIIFCGNMIATIANRMRYGALLIAINNAWPGTSFNRC
jgi:hypothetical protein